MQSFPVIKMCNVGLNWTKRNKEKYFVPVNSHCYLNTKAAQTLSSKSLNNMFHSTAKATEIPGQIHQDKPESEGSCLPTTAVSGSETPYQTQDGHSYQVSFMGTRENVSTILYSFCTLARREVCRIHLYFIHNQCLEERIKVFIKDETA